MPFWWSSGRWRPGLARALLGHIHPVDATKATADGDELAAVNSFQVASWACETLPECLRCLMGLPEACRSICARVVEVLIAVSEKSSGPRPGVCQYNQYDRSAHGGTLRLSPRLVLVYRTPHPHQTLD